MGKKCVQLLDKLRIKMGINLTYAQRLISTKVCVGNIGIRTRSIRGLFHTAIRDSNYCYSTALSPSSTPPIITTIGKENKDHKKRNQLN